VPHQPFRDELAERRRTMLVLFYCAAARSIIAVALSGRISSLRTPLLVIAAVAAVTTIFLLLRFLRSNDEHERLINYRALAFAFAGTRLSACSGVSAFIPSPG
jgi:hypothetical protein